MSLWDNVEIIMILSSLHQIKNEMGKVEYGIKLWVCALKKESVIEVQMLRLGWGTLTRSCDRWVHGDILETVDIITQGPSWPKILLPLGLWGMLLSRIFFPPSFPLPSSDKILVLVEGHLQYPISLTSGDQVGLPALNFYFTLSFSICMTAHKIYYYLYSLNQDKDLASRPHSILSTESGV